MSNHKGKFRSVEKFNTDEHDQNQVSYNLTKHVISKMIDEADEHIGYVQRDVISATLPEIFEFNQIKDAVAGQMSYELRDLVESNAKYVQFIPIAVVRDRETGQVLAGMKAAKALNENSPETGKVLLWFGGHLREEDSTLFESPSPLDVLKQCVYREVKEEIGIDVSSSEVNPICIWVRDGSRSEYHMAVVFDICLDLNNVRVRVDESEFLKSGTGVLKTVEPIALDYVRTLLPRLDSWSRGIAERVLLVGAAA